MLKQGLANINKYREEDSKKSDAMLAHIEDNKKSTQDKITALEKFILGVKEATEKATTQTRPQSQFEASLNLMEDVKALVSRTDSMSYKFDALSYDLNLIKTDIIRQQRTAQGYFEKVEKIEKKVDALHLAPGIGLGRSNAGLNNTSGGNFMVNASRTIDDNLLHRLNQQEYSSKDGSNSTNDHMTVPVPLPQTTHIQGANVGQRNYFMDEEFDKEFGKEFGRDHFGGNLSIIDKGGGNYF
jgi:hypothetical protein